MVETYPDVSVIIPAYCEEGVIAQVVRDVAAELERADITHEIIVIDDGSPDTTAQIAREAGATVLQHPYNIGNGAAIKTGIRHAQGDVIVMMDGDGQHRAEDIPRLLALISQYDMVVGARTPKTQSGLHRSLANRLYNALASYLACREIPDLTSGLRAVRADVAKRFAYLLPNGFSYPSTITLTLIRSGYSVEYIPIEAQPRVGQSKIRLFQDGTGFLFIIIRIAALVAPARVFMPVAFFFLGFGSLYTIYRVFWLGRFNTIATLLLLVGLLVFLLGLIAEQIALLRMSRT